MSKGKYHISKDGMPRICTAEGNCPLGGNEHHFKTYKEAYEHSKEILSERYGVLAKIASKQSEYEGLKDDGKKSTEMKREFNKHSELAKTGKDELEKKLRGARKEAQEHESKELRKIRKGYREQDPNLSNYQVDKKAKSDYARTDEARWFKNTINQKREDIAVYNSIVDKPEYLTNLKKDIELQERKEERQDKLTVEAEGSKTIFKDGDLDVTHSYTGSNVKIDGGGYKIEDKLTTDNDGNINNLFLVHDNGNIDKIVKLNDGYDNLVLDNGVETSLSHTSTITQGIMKRQNYSIKVGKPNGETYDGFNEIYINEIDTSD